MLFMNGFPPGDLIDGRYQVVTLLGKGGMGMVYQVRDRSQPEGNQLLALKILLPSLSIAQDIQPQLLEGLRDRFIDEATFCMKLNHPNIVRVKGVFENQDLVYIVMAFIDGQDLSKWLKTNRSADIPARWRIIEDICNGLAYAHGKQIYHRDVKPTNIMVARSGANLLVDFGLAKLTEQALGEWSQLGGLGSRLYAAPEQWRGDPYDQTVDVYSMGLVCIEALTGHYPGNPPKPDMMAELEACTHSRVATVLKKATALAPSDRYAGIEHFRRDLKSAIDAVSTGSVTSVESMPDPGISPASTIPPNIGSTLPPLVEPDLVPTTEPLRDDHGLRFRVAVGLAAFLLLILIIWLWQHYFLSASSILTIPQVDFHSLATGRVIHPAEGRYCLRPGERARLRVSPPIGFDEQPMQLYYTAISGDITVESPLSARYRAPDRSGHKDIIIVTLSNINTGQRARKPIAIRTIKDMVAGHPPLSSAHP
jgi:serine/threonine protein kinase